MDIKKIDMHVHPHYAGGPERPRGGTWPTPEEVGAAYKTYNIEKGVIMPNYAPEHMHDPITSRNAEEMAKRYPEIFGWWFCALDPRMISLHQTQSDNFAHFLDYFKAHGARGVGELQANMYIDDPRMMNMFYHCEKQHMPVTIHFTAEIDGVNGVVDDLGLPRLEKVMEQFPNLTILGHAMTFWVEISAEVPTRTGRPTGKVTEGRLAKLLRKFPNLVCDISAGSGLNALTRDPEYSYRFIDEFYEQIVFATDISGPVTISETAKKLCAFLDDGYREGNISEIAYRCICRENALRILEHRDR